MECMSYVSASAPTLVNGSLTNEFALGMGLHQGDYLLLFLFVIAAKYLNVLLKASIDVGLYNVNIIGEKLEALVRVLHL